MGAMLSIENTEHIKDKRKTHFKDNYNSNGLFHNIGLSWTKTINTFCKDEKGSCYLYPSHIPTFRKVVTTAWENFKRKDNHALEQQHKCEQQYKWLMEIFDRAEKSGKRIVFYA